MYIYRAIYLEKLQSGLSGRMGDAGWEGPFATDKTPYFHGRARKTADLATDKTPNPTAICRIWLAWPLTGPNSARHLWPMPAWPLTRRHSDGNYSDHYLWHLAGLAIDRALKPRVATDWPRGASLTGMLG